jgi:hypothetical protein
LVDAAAAGDWTGEAKVTKLCRLFGSADIPIQELMKADGASIWVVDGIHRPLLVYRVISRLLIAEMEKDGDDGGKPRQ